MAAVVHRRLLWSLALTLTVPACFSPNNVGPHRAMALWQKADLWRARGAAAPGSAKTLNLEQALALALRHNLSVRAMEARVDEARAGISAASQLDNPEVRVRDIEIDAIAESRPRVDLALRVPIPHPWIRDARSSKAELETAGARARADEVKRRIRAEVRKLFVTLAVLDLDRQQMQQAASLSLKHQQLVGQRLAVKAATRLDHSMTGLRHAETMDRLASLDIRRADTVQRLRRIIGISPKRRITFLTAKLSSRAKAARPDEARLVKRALSKRPDLREAAARVGQARADAYIARARRWPWLRFAELGYGVRPNPDPLNFEISFALDIPLLSLNLGRIAVRDARVSRRELEEKARVMKVAQDVGRACNRVRMTASRLEAMDKLLLPAVKKTNAALSDAVSQGAVDPLDVMVAESRRIRARRQHLKAVLAHHLALIELQSVTGQ
jgi:outer membrane protein TolC